MKEKRAPYPDFIERFDVNEYICTGYTKIGAIDLIKEKALFEVWESVLSYEHGEERLFNHIIYWEEARDDSEEFCRDFAKLQCEALKRGISIMQHPDRFLKRVMKINDYWKDKLKDNS